MVEKAATELEFKARYAAHMQAQAGMGEVEAQNVAQAGWEAALTFNENSPEAALNDLTPEEAAGEEMACWSE